MRITNPAVVQSSIRQRAKESMLNDNSISGESLPPEKMQQLLHELRVHKVELEIQNEELRRTQNQLEESRARYFDLYDLAPVGYLSVSEYGLILEANLTFATMVGAARYDLFRQSITSFIFTEDQDSYYLQRKKLEETGAVQSLDIRMLHSDGSIFHAHMQTTPAQNGECRITVENIDELWQARQELFKAQKIESLGVLAGGIAHDFNNILAAILGNISMARLQLHEPENADLRLHQAEKATLRAKDLAKQLITFARGGEPVKKSIDVRSILKEAAGFALLGSNIKCVLSVANDLLPVEADEGQIVQVIHNLVLNAVQAMPGGGTITVNADNVSARQSGNKFVKFSVEDTGPGISEENLQKIFDPYFSTKQDGSGLGLASCYSIIMKHGGKIRATSILGEGSAFTISLPASIQNNVSIPDTRQELFRGTGRVLIMDDEEMIRGIEQALLEELGYMVESAENGSEAVDLYLKRKEQGEPFDAVILDLIIPGEGGGKETIKKLLEIDPNVKAIVCSGYSNDPIISNYRDYGFKGALCKPFQLEEFSKVINKVLTP